LPLLKFQPSYIHKTSQ